MIAVVFPQTVYALSALIGVDLPINLLLTAFALFSLVMMFYLTCIVSRENEKLRTLTQQLALLEKRLRDLEARRARKETGGAVDHRNTGQLEKRRPCKNHGRRF